jgi:hypothetical protein
MLRTRWPRHDANACRRKARERRSDRLATIWQRLKTWTLCGTSRRRPVRQLCLGPNVAHQAGPERCPPGRRGAAPTSCPPQSPGRSLRHLTSPAASWVIRRPLVAMALVALLSVACEGEQAATPPAATSSHLIVVGPNPAPLQMRGRCARCGYPTAHRRGPGREHVLLRQGSLSAHQHSPDEGKNADIRSPGRRSHRQGRWGRGTIRRQKRSSRRGRRRASITKRGPNPCPLIRPR